MSVSLSLCQFSLSLSTCLSVFLFFCFPIYFPMFQCFGLLLCFSFCVSVCCYVFLSVFLSVVMLFFLCFCLFFCVSVSVSVLLSILKQGVRRFTTIQSRFLIYSAKWLRLRQYTKNPLLQRQLDKRNKEVGSQYQPRANLIKTFFTAVFTDNRQMDR